MLRVMDDSRTTPSKAWMAVAIAGLVGLSLGMLTLSSLAGPPQQQPELPKIPAAANDQREPVARLANRPDAPARLKNELAKELFHHDPVDAPQIESNANGSIHLRVAELFQREDLAFLRAIADQQLQKEWADLMPGGPALDLRIDDIEAITCDLKIAIRILNETAERSPDNKNGSLSVGGSGFLLRLSKRLNWRELCDNLPQLVKHDLEGRPGFEFPVIPALGPSPERPFLVFLDDTTVLFSVGDGFLKQWLKNEVVRSHSLERDMAWKAVDGGLLTFVHDCDPAIWSKLSPAVLEEQERVAVEVTKRVSRISVGLDWMPTTNELGVRCRLETGSPTDAAFVQQLLGQLSSALRPAQAAIEAPILEKLRRLIAATQIDQSTVIISGEFPLTPRDFLPAQIATRP